MTSYFTGFLIQGEAGEWHYNLTKTISEKFGTWDLHEKLPPHVTIFYPFKSEDPRNIRQLLKNRTENRPVPGKIVLDDFDRFDDRVVFASVKAENRVGDFVSSLQRELKAIPGMPPGEFPEWHPHATLANKVSPEEIRKIWEFVKKLPKPDFSLAFDNVTLFRFEGDQKWVVDEMYRLKKPGA